MTLWSTDAVAPKERFSFWHAVVCQAVLNVATESPPRERFRARISSRRFGALRCAAFDSSSHEIVRRAAHVSSASDDGYLVSLQRRGEGHIEQADHRFVLKPGEIAILDGARPFRIRFPGPVQRLVAVVPRALLDARAPWLRRMPGRKITADSPMVDLARRHLIQMAEGDPDLQVGDAAMLCENLCNLVAMATAPAATERRSLSEAGLAVLLALGRQHLCDPDLSPHSLAALVGISLRTLHLRFRQLGCTWSRWLLENRLQLCAKALKDPRRRGVAISQIAYDAGFNDLSHFNKSFRLAYGMTPGEWRNMPVEARRDCSGT